MFDFFTQNLVLGLFGAVIAEILQFKMLRSQGRRAQVFRACLVALFGAMYSDIYLAGDSSGHLVAFQIAVFMTLAAEDFLDDFDTMGKNGRGSKEGKESVRSQLTAVAGVGTGLILNGWFPVLGAGCFGALLAEINRIRLKRGKWTSIVRSEWAWSIAVILTSGIVTSFHGVDHINALTAAQLGAAGPLVVGRLRF